MGRGRRESAAIETFLLQPTYLLLTLIRTAFLCNFIGTYVDNSQHAIFLCFSMLMRTVLKVYMLSSDSRYARLINLTEQSIDRATRSVNCTVNLVLIKHYNLEYKIQDTTQGIKSYPRYNFSLLST